MAINESELNVSEMCSCSLDAETLFDEVEVDFVAQPHAILEGALVVGLGAFGLDVLLDGVNLRLVLDQLLLDVVQTDIDVTLQDLVLLSVVLHRVVGHLTLQAWLVLGQEGPDRGEPHFFPVEVDLQLIRAGELVGHLVLHLTDFFSHLLHLLLDAALQRFDLLQVVLSLL